MPTQYGKVRWTSAKPLASVTFHSPYTKHPNIHPFVSGFRIDPKPADNIEVEIVIENISLKGFDVRCLHERFEWVDVSWIAQD